MRCFCSAGYPPVKVGDDVYRMIPVVSARVRPNVLLTLGSCADQFLRCRFLRQDEFGICYRFDRSCFYSPCVRQYCLSLSPSLSSVSCLRVRNQNTSLNEAMHNANDTKMTIANASHSLA